MGEGGLAEYSILNPCFVVVFLEKKTSSCKGYACTQLACGIWAIVMFSAAYIGLPSASPRVVHLN